MPATSRLPELRDLIREKQDALPETKRRRIAPRRAADGQREGQDRLNKEYTAEAYVIVSRWEMSFIPS